MATMAKKIYMKDSTGNQQTALLYSTIAEMAGAEYINMNVDDIDCYAPLVPISIGRATSSRVTKTDGNTYAIARNTVTEYSYTVFNKAGSGTFTVPANVYKLRVTCVGGGAGGVECYPNSDSAANWNSKFVASISDNAPNVSFSQSVGIQTNFSSVVARGATAPIWNLSWSGSTGEVKSITPSYGTVNGSTSMKTNSYVYGAGGVAMTDISGTTVASVGAGGYADGDVSSIAAGGSGYKTVDFLDVTPGQVISYTVGRGGYGRCGWKRVTITSGYYNKDGAGAGYGDPGGILVEWGKGIE